MGRRGNGEALLPDYDNPNHQHKTMETNEETTADGQQQRVVMQQAINDVLEERFRQDQKWGEQNHDPIVYSAILTEEVGELSQAALQARFEGGDVERVREEAVQAAAVAVAIVECLDRDKWQWPAV